jgi:rSAM/selenodomain-associated transferase 2
MVSVIIPTWNEAKALPATLRALEGQGTGEIWIVDAGSTDGTPEIAHRASVTLITSPKKQRALQLNLGAQNSKGDIFLFLHADTILPVNGIAAIQNALKNETVIGGAFARTFDSSSLFLKATCLLAEIRNRAVGWHLGDQAMFIRARVFRQSGGFKLWDKFEDLEFSWRMSRAGKVVTLRPGVVSSSRRFENLGPVRTTLRDLWWTLQFLRRR